MTAHQANIRQQQCDRACQAASVLSANQELRKRIHLWGSVLSCLKEFKRDGWMEKAKGKTLPVLRAQIDARGKENPFYNLIPLNCLLRLISSVTWRNCALFLCLDPLCFPPTARLHHWNQVISLLAQFFFTTAWCNRQQSVAPLITVAII